MVYDKHILALAEKSPEMFIRRFWNISGEYKTSHEAYEAVERLHSNAFKRRRYSDFESFKQVKNRWLKDRKKQR